jgi:hypothetical protein
VSTDIGGDDSAGYKEYYDYYMKYYKQQYGIGEGKKKKTGGDEKKTESSLAAIAGYGGSDSEGED